MFERLIDWAQKYTGLMFKSSLSNKLFKYKYMETFKERLLEEYLDLGAKIKRLQTFLKTDAFKRLPSNQQLAIDQQRVFMKGYYNLLNYRIKTSFNHDEKTELINMPIKKILNKVKYKE